MIDRGAAAVFLGDHDALMQAVSNLLDNAVKYSPGGGPTVLRLARRARRDHHGDEMKAWESPPTKSTFPQEVRARAKSHRARHQRHGPRPRARIAHRRGSRRPPRDRQPGRSWQFVHSRAAGGADADAFSSSRLHSMPRILIVEDEPAIVLSLEEDLGRQGYDTEVARDGERAIGSGRSSAGI